MPSKEFMSISYYNFISIILYNIIYYRCSCKHQRRCSRNCGTRDVEYDEVEKVLVSKTRDKDNDCKRKRKRSSSKDLGHKRDRKERDNHLRDK